ncbi:putative acyl-activating enzyme 6 [Bienertia sinuspersici]
MEELKATIKKSTPLTPLTFLERAAIVYSDCLSIIYNNTTYTWSDTNRRCLQAASAITTLGIRTSDVVSVVSPNVPAAYELHFAVPMSGAILNNINTRLNASAISLILHHSQSKLVFVYHQLSSLVLEALSLLPPHHPKPLLVLISDDNNDNHNDNQSNQFCCTYEGLIKRGDPKFKWDPPASEWDPIVLNYTSGTTSSPKGVVRCHRASYISALDSLIDWSVPKQPVYLWTLPMFHSNGWSFTWAMAAVGATNICLGHLDGGTIYHLIRQHKVTHMCAAPVVLNMLINHHAQTTTSLLKNPVHFLTGGVEVESVLYTIPGVNEAAVVAQPHEFWGETPCAFVCFKNDVEGKPSEKEVIEYCRVRLPHYMVPKRVVFRDELPKTSTGKTQKNVLREMARTMIQTSRL